MFARGGVLGEFDAGGDGAAVQPAVGVYAEDLAFEGAEVRGLVDGLEEGEEAWLISLCLGGTLCFRYYDYEELGLPCIPILNVLGWEMW